MSAADRLVATWRSSIDEPAWRRRGRNSVRGLWPSLARALDELVAEHHHQARLALDPLPHATATAHARATDPTTSHVAARTDPNYHRPNLRRTILDLLERHGPMTDETIAHRLAALGVTFTPSGARSRRRELVDLGYVAVFGSAVAGSATGRPATVWYALPIDARPQDARP